MNYEENVLYLMEHLKTSVVDSKDSSETMDLLAEITEVDLTTVTKIAKELAKRADSNESMTSRRNAFHALCIILRRHPDLHDCQVLISDSDIYRFALAAIRLQE